MTRRTPAVSVRIAAMVVFAAVASAASAARGGSVFISTGHTGAQVQVDAFHTQYWTYTVTQDVPDVYGGLFDMKVGPKTKASITFDIFEGTYADHGSADPLLAVTLTPPVFSKSDFMPVLFAGTPITLHAGTTYTAVLSSSAPDPQSRAYFIKGGNPLPYLADSTGRVVNTGGTLIDPSAYQPPGSTDDPSGPVVSPPGQVTVPTGAAVPLPATSAASAGLLGLLGLGRILRPRRHVT